MLTAQSLTAVERKANGEGTMGKEQRPVDVVQHFTTQEERKMRQKSGEQTLVDMYAAAKAAGYQGSYEDWKRIMGGSRG